MKPISRQRQWQLNQISMGLCSLCANLLSNESKQYCDHHLNLSRSNGRKYYRNNTDKCRQLVKAWNERNPDYQPNYQKTYQAEYRRVNREALNAKQRAAYAARKAKAAR